MSHSSERAIRSGQRFIGKAIVLGESIYRAPRRGKTIKGKEPEPLPLDMSVAIESNPIIDTFLAGVAYYDLPLTSRNLSLSWRGGMLPKKQSVVRVMDDEGNHVRQETEVGVFGLYTGIENVEGSKWFDINRAAKPSKRSR